jgi:hypothetical protein
MLEKSAHLSLLSKSPDGFAYERHKPEDTDLYKIIEQNLPSFQSHLSNADIRYHHLSTVNSAVTFDADY